jgi:hypothetical protein
MQNDTIFDIASLSKPVSTAVCVLILIDRAKSTSTITYRNSPGIHRGAKKKFNSYIYSRTLPFAELYHAEPLEKKYGSPCPIQVFKKICSLKTQSAPAKNTVTVVLGISRSGKSLKKYQAKH